MYICHYVSFLYLFENDTFKVTFVTSNDLAVVKLYYVMGNKENLVYLPLTAKWVLLWLLHTYVDIMYIGHV